MSQSVRNKSNYNNKNDKPREYKPTDENTVVGRNAVKELLESGRDVEKLYIKKGELEGSLKLLISIAKEKRLTVVEVEKSKLDYMSGGLNHQGVIAVASEAEYSSVDDILAYAEGLGEKPFLVLLDGVEDPHNLGAIIRSAECCGAHGIIIPKRRSAGLNATVAKSSAGALMHMRVARVTNLASTIDELKQRGLWLFAADMGGDEYYKTDMTCAAAIVLGSEGFGISRLVKEKCDFTVSIPLRGKVNSMNVSCAAAVILSEVSRQRSLS